jgi:hemoglobin
MYMSMDGTDARSLYERLGGVYGIAHLVEHIATRLRDHPVIVENPKVREAFARLPKAGSAYRVTEYICAHIGGPQNYTGRPLTEVHSDLGITQAQWDFFIRGLLEALNDLQVPAAEQRDLVKAFEDWKPSIVFGPER